MQNTYNIFDKLLSSDTFQSYLKNTKSSEDILSYFLVLFWCKMQTCACAVRNISDPDLKDGTSEFFVNWEYLKNYETHVAKAMEKVLKF